MRLKKGFTLAEVLIVLMVIGVIATLTVPSLLRGVTEAQYKAAYKKAYNAIVNLTAMDKISGSLPSTRANAYLLFASMASNLSVKEFNSTGFNTGTIPAMTTYNAQAKFTDVTGNIVNSDSTTSISYTTSATTSPWIITEDNIAYLVTNPTSLTCGTKADINSQTSLTNVVNKACSLIVVDVNGLTKGPNQLEAQVTTDLNNKAVSQLVGDQYYIYVGSDGATAGPKAYTLAGRIVGDIK